MKKLLELTIELMDAVVKQDIHRIIEIVDTIKSVSDTYKRSC